MPYTNKARQLMSLTPTDAVKFMKSFDIVICNCEGVLWNYIETIPETGLGIMSLKMAGKQVKFLSGNSMPADNENLQKLKSIGITDVKDSDIITPGKVMLNYLKAYYAGMRVYSLCSAELNTVFQDNGIKLESMEPSTDISMDEMIRKLTPDSKIAAVLYDLNFNLTYVQLAKAQQYLCMDGCAFVVSQINTFVQISKEISTLGTAGIISILRDMSGKEPITLGKRGTTLGEEIIATYNIRDRSRVLYIGDNLFADMPFAHRCGFQTLFVWTGISKAEQMSMLLDQQKPDYTTSSVADFLEFFQKNGRPNSDI